MQTKKLKSLNDHNTEAYESHRVESLRSGAAVLCGLACPKCGNELTEYRTVILASMPPKTAVLCECGYYGYKVL